MRSAVFCLPVTMTTGVTQEECEKFGSVKSVHIPRPSTTSEEEKPGVGFVFVAFDAVDSAAKAAASLRARTFDGRKVCVCVFICRFCRMWIGFWSFFCCFGFACIFVCALSFLLRVEYLCFYS